ncbi:MAG: hypothetical protein HAW63_04400, partial [Bdellovibrionaceae bacterium]|nr:hypothetical protein [Pseudobdellovibrionaceae bacterium]
MFIGKYLLGFVFLFFTACSGYETDGVRSEIGGGHSSVQNNAASFSQALNLTGTKRLEDWLGVSVQEAKDTKLHLNLQYSGHRNTEGSATYEGEFSISYQETSGTGEKINRELVLDTGSTEKETQYNYVYLDKEGQFTWKAFFQDEFGSILIILTQGEKADECSASDGCDNQIFFSMGNGTVYYRNWPTDRGQAFLPEPNCWLVTAGPYDCRTWKTDKGIDLDKAVFPDGSAGTLSGRAGARGYCYRNGKRTSPCDNIAYTKLGTFKDLDFKILFQIDPDLASAR